jgi:Domain of unknown function (DUF4276)
VVRDLWLYVEGGGTKDSRDHLRRAFSEFLSEPRSVARQKGIGWRVVMCGSREATVKAFREGAAEHPHALVLMLVDSDRPVDGTPREHLAGGDTRWNLASAEDGQIHLMAQVMESWFVADIDALERFYGQGFAAGQIPRRRDVEEVPKDDVFASLNSATRRTQKGRYHKIQHGPAILESLNPKLVRARAPHCERLFTVLSEALAA